MKLETIGGSLNVGRRIEGIAQDRVADGEHVDTQLMGPARQRDELHTGDAGLAGEHLPLGPGGAPALVVDALARLVLPVGGERQVDDAAVAYDITPDAGD